MRMRIIERNRKRMSRCRCRRDARLAPHKFETTVHEGYEYDIIIIMDQEAGDPKPDRGSHGSDRFSRN